MNKSFKLLRIILVYSFILFLLLIFAKTSLAITSRSGSSVLISGKEVINDNVFASGQVIKIESDVNGDIYCAGQTVEINSNVKGDVICAAQTIVIEGLIDGNVRAAAQNLTLKGEVTRNVTIAGQNIVSDAIVGRDMFFGSQNSRINGIVKRNLSGGAESVYLNAVIGNEVSLFATNLDLASGAKVKGNLTYVSENEASISKEASVSGKIIRNIPEPRSGQRREITKKLEQTPQHILTSRFRSMVINLLIVLVLVYFFRNFFKKITDLMIGNVKEYSLTGLLIVLLTPVVFLFLMLTIIGIPFAVAGLILFALLACFARMLSAVTVGVALTNKYFNAQKSSLLFASGVGVVASWIGFSIPVFRWFLTLFYIIWGLGALYRYFHPNTSKK